MFEAVIQFIIFNALYYVKIFILHDIIVFWLGSRCVKFASFMWQGLKFQGEIVLFSFALLARSPFIKITITRKFINTHDIMSSYFYVGQYLVNKQYRIITRAHNFLLQWELIKSSVSAKTHKQLWTTTHVVLVYLLHSSLTMEVEHFLSCVNK